MRGDALQVNGTRWDAGAIDSRTAPAEAGAALVGDSNKLEGELTGDLQNAVVASAGDLSE